jgi:tetratricopeptide (TPR) repeat protein
VLNFFGRKKDSSTPSGSSQTPNSGAGDGGDMKPPATASGAFEPDPAKARKFFDHARTIAQTGNAAYSLTLYASGLKFDPSNMQAHNEMYETAIRYFQAGGKPAARGDIKKFDGSGPVDRFVASEFAWMHDLNNLSLALDLLEAAAKATQLEFGKWFAPRILNMMRKQKITKKGQWISAKDQFVRLQTWNEAFEAAEVALQIDPADGGLQAEMKDLQAQLAIERGGFNNPQTQNSGGFRSNIKDADKQRELEERDSLTGSADVEERNLLRAKKDFDDNPMSPEAIAKYAQLLKRRNTPESEDEAHGVYITGYERLGEYRFRMLAGDIRISQLDRRVRAAKERLDAQPEDLILKTEYEELRKQLLELRSSELRERTQRYPTDRGIKIELGKLEFDLGRYEDAMTCFQNAKDEIKFRVVATHMLGKCFAAEGWHTEAIGEFREALQHLDSSQKENELPIKYDLMVSLIEHARAEKSPASAKEASDICSAIVRTNIGYRDIKEKRKELDVLRKELGG